MIFHHNFSFIDQMRRTLHELRSSIRRHQQEMKPGIKTYLTMTVNRLGAQADMVLDSVSAYLQEMICQKYPNRRVPEITRDQAENFLKHAPPGLHPDKVAGEAMTRFGFSIRDCPIVRKDL